MLTMLTIWYPHAPRWRIWTSPPHLLTMSPLWVSYYFPYWWNCWSISVTAQNLQSLVQSGFFLSSIHRIFVHSWLNFNFDLCLNRLCVPDRPRRNRSKCHLLHWKLPIWQFHFLQQFYLRLKCCFEFPFISNTSSSRTASIWDIIFKF